MRGCVVIPFCPQDLSWNTGVLHHSLAPRPSSSWTQFLSCAEAAMHCSGGQRWPQPGFFLPVCWKHKTLKRNFTELCWGSGLHWSSWTWHFSFRWGCVEASILSCHVGWGSPWDSGYMCVQLQAWAVRVLTGCHLHGTSQILARTLRVHILQHLPVLVSLLWH